MSESNKQAEYEFELQCYEEERAMSEELKPCPYHTGECDLGFEVKELSVNDRWYKVVADCGASGPECSRKDEAIRFWNTRAEIPKAWWDRLFLYVNNRRVGHVREEMKRIERGE